MIPKFGFGAYLHGENFYFGASIPTLWVYDKDYDFNVDIDKSSWWRRHYFISGAYAFKNIYELLKYSKYIIDNNITFNNEPYTSCIIDKMIENNEPFVGVELNNKSVNVLGTPLQVENYIKNNFKL